MDITYVGTQEDGKLTAVIEGKKYFGISETSIQFYPFIEKWVSEGNTIPEYVEPTPSPATDTPINRVQFKSMLSLLGKSITDVEAAIDLVVTDPTQNTIAKVKVSDSDYYARDNELFTILAPFLNLTDVQIDAAWEQAVLI